MYYFPDMENEQLETDVVLSAACIGIFGGVVK
jgi:hypothetical protein